MSGLEIAGCVLGVFPLILSAMEGYENGFSLMKDWWKFRTEWNSFVHDVSTQKVLFFENIELLLAPVVRDDEHMQQLLQDPNSDAWADEYLDERLRERLRNSYELYFATVIELKAAVDKLVDKLNVDNDVLIAKDNSPPGKGMKWDYEYKRIRFTLQRKKRDLLIAKLEKNNKKLSELLDSSLRLEPHRQTRKKRPLVAAFNKIQEHALQLHQAISKSWHCACPSAHGANLMLEKRIDEPTSNQQPPRSPRPSTPRSPGFPTAEQSRFQLLFYYEANPFELPPSWSETEVIVDEAHEAPEYSSHSHSGSYDHSSRPSAIRSASSPSRPVEKEALCSPLQEKNRTKSMLSSFSSLRPGSSKSLRPVSPNPSIRSSKSSRKSVSFNEPQSPPPSYSPGSPYLSAGFNDSSSTLVEEGPSVGPKAGPLAAEVADLCEVIAKCSSTTSCLGYLTDTTKKRKFNLFPFITKTHCPASHELVSLDKLLSGRVRWTRKDRLSIASTLASSLLQLQSTPWLGEGWSKKDILFLRNKTDPRNPILTDRPYISKSFLSSRSPKSSTTGAAAADDDCASQDPEKPLQSLAILLLELCFGESLEAQTDLMAKYLDRNGEKNDFTDFATAKAWLPDVEGECGAEYLLAVKKCLTGCFEKRVDWANDEFRRCLWEEVVMPVEEVVKAFG